MMQLQVQNVKDLDQDQNVACMKVDVVKRTPIHIEPRTKKNKDGTPGKI